MIRWASYAKQSGSGAPLVVDGKVDEAAVALLSRFDDVTLEITPWAQDLNGLPRPDVPLMLRRLNPRIRLWLYALVGDQWLSPSFKPQDSDRSGFRDAFDAVNGGNGWLYDMDGNQWLENYRVNLADTDTVLRLSAVYARFVATHLFDGIFLDDAHTSIAWTTRNAPSMLDVGRAGFDSSADMDAARLANINLLVESLKDAGGQCFMVAVNGTGPKPEGVDYDMREGLGRLINVADASAWLRSPGNHWLKAEAYTPEEVKAKVTLLKLMAPRGAGDVILSCGPDRGWKPEGR